MNTKLGWAGLALATLLTACGGAGHDLRARLSDSNACVEVQADDGPGAGSAGAHGQPQRKDGDVQIFTDGSDVVARQVVSIANDFGGAGNGNVTLATGAGDVVDCVRGNGGYRTNVHLEGRGSTEQEARDALASMSVTHSDMLMAGTLKLSTAVQFSNPAGTGGGGGGINVCVPPITTCGGGGSGRRSASIIAGLPSAPSYVFDDSSGAGDVFASGFSGSNAKLSSSAGDVGLDGAWGQSSLDTSAGDVFAQLRTLRSGTHTMTSSAGEVDVALLVSGSPAFDLTADTSAGTASIDVAGTDPVGDQSERSAHRQSPSYASSAVKISVDAASSAGDVTIHD